MLFRPALLQTASVETKLKLTLETKTQAFLDAVEAQGGKPIYQLSYADARQVLEAAQSGPIAKPPADVVDMNLPTGPDGTVSVRIYRPHGSQGALPAVIYCHGGGWVLGSKNTHDRLMRDFVNRVNAAFVFVNYTPSPEAQFPKPFEQAYAVAKYVAGHGSELNLDGGRLAMAGDSAGGSLAIAVTLLAKERGGPHLRQLALFYPVADAGMNTGSYEEFGDGPWLTKAGMQWFWDAYAPNAADRRKITASPLQATADQLRGLPPALILTSENDVLRDEGEGYARKLLEAGVSVTAVRYLGTIHDFMMLNGIADTPARESATNLAAATLGEAFAEEL